MSTDTDKRVDEYIDSNTLDDEPVSTPAEPQRCPDCGHEFVAFDAETYDCRVQPYADIGDPVICGCDHDFHAERDTPPTTEAADARKPLRFRITYDDFGYKVSIPTYSGGEVVAAEDYDAEVSRLREALRGTAIHERDSGPCWCFTSTTCANTPQCAAARAAIKGDKDEDVA